MSDILHSHSTIERELDMPKHTVLVDVQFSEMFKNCATQTVRYDGVDYLKVPTMSFVKNGGVFKQ